MVLGIVASNKKKKKGIVLLLNFVQVENLYQQVMDLVKTLVYSLGCVD